MSPQKPAPVQHSHKSRHKTPVRAPGRARVERIVETTIKLLKNHSLDEITISMIAVDANISRTSIYEFFPTVAAIYRVIAERYVQELDNDVKAFVLARRTTTLGQFLDTVIDAIVSYFNSHPATMKVHLGSNAQFELRAIIHNFDTVAAKMYHDLRKVEWDPKPLSEEDPFRTLVILQTSLFSASVQRHGYITDYMAEQTKIVARAYLAHYSQDVEQWRDENHPNRKSSTNLAEQPTAQRRRLERRLHHLLGTLDDRTLEIAVSQTAMLVKLRPQ